MARKKLVVLSGAGVSAESGFSTFRDNGGLWDRYDPQDVATPEGWQRNPAYVLEFYNGLREQLRDAKPNEAHRIIAEMEKDYDVTVITQNVDNLHERAGSTRIIHLHGEATKVRPEVGAYEQGFSEREVFDIAYDRIELGDKAPNGRQLRPHIVWFGESVPKIEAAIDEVAKADIFVIVGTSLTVYPAAGLYRYADPKAPIYLIDPKEVSIHDNRMIHIQEVATAGMNKLRKILENG